jgi:phosphatidate cytidylyltransferase
VSKHVSKGGRSELATRAGVALLLVGLAFAALYTGGVVFWLLIVVAGLLMLSEWAELAGVTEKQKRIAQYALSVPLAAMCPWALGADFLVLGMVFGAAFFTAAVLKRGQMGWGVVYVGLPVLALVYLRAQPNGILLTLWAMALVWACDSGAYFAGRAIGGPKLAPSISPNKTWAGFLGGVLTAALFGWILHEYFDLHLGLAIATPFLAALAQGGDLYESHLKRRAGVKDSGNLLPGHGGLMDRLDGLVAVAPVAALLLLLLK